MLGKLILTGALFASMGANAATAVNQIGTDESGASVGKTAIVNLPSQSLAFNFSGTLDLDGPIQVNNNAGAVFGLYKGSTLLKDISQFVAGANDNYTFSFSNLVAGNNYSLRFNITGGGNYILTSSISPFTAVTPVPEPENLGLLMLGLGVMTAFIRRQKKA